MHTDSVFYKLFGVQQLPAYEKPESAVRFEVKMNEILSQEEYEARENAKKKHWIRRRTTNLRSICRKTALRLSLPNRDLFTFAPRRDRHQCDEKVCVGFGHCPPL